MKHLYCAVFALLPLTGFASTFPIEVESSLNGAEVTYDSQSINYNMAALSVSNHGSTSAQCTAVFRNGPEAPKTRKLLLKGGEKGNVTARFTSEIIKLRIRLDCKPK
jgi:hypothetical protein